jgi:1-acyl-sn-glycerol-3-phosphate acyltransferase
VTNHESSENAAETVARLLDAVRDVATELHPRQRLPGPVTLDSSLDRDLGLDSLARVELVARVERIFDVALAEQVFSSVETPRDLVRAVLGATGRRSTFIADDVGEAALGEAEAAPVTAQTLVDVLAWHAATHPDRPHIRFYSDAGDGEVITYRGLKDGAERIAAGLQELDVKRGETVVIMLPTGRDYFFSFFGVLIAGAVPVPIYPPGRPAQIEEHLRRHVTIANTCMAGLMITIDGAKRFAGQLRAQVPTLRDVVTPGELAAAAAGIVAAPVFGALDTAFVQFTSGSTGNPKGVVLTHANLLANIRAMGTALDAGPDDVFVSWLPLYHDMGLIGAWLGSLYYACQLVIMSPLTFLARPQRWLWAIHRHRATISGGPNFAYELCLRRLGDEDLEGLDLSHWRIAFNGAEPVNPDTMDRFCQRFAGVGFRAEAMMPVYGLAECSVGLAFTPLGRGAVVDRVRRQSFMVSGRAEPAAPDDDNALGFVSCGRPLPGHQLRVVDATGRELPERQEGRLQFRGPSATSGYLRNPDETGRLFDGNWLDAGDRGYVAAGEVHITGRDKDIVIRAGRNIYPAELEDAVGAVPGIRRGNVAVFGSADPATGTERLIILAESRKRDPGERAELRAAINALATDLAGGPADDVVLAPPNTVPKTSSGKIRRSASREVYEHDLIGKPQPTVRLQIARLAVAGLVPRLGRARRRLAAWLYAAYAHGLFFLLAPFVWGLVAILPRSSWCWAMARAGARCLFAAAGVSPTVRGLENLPTVDQPCVLAANHSSYIDGPVLLAALPRPFGFVAKAELRGNVVSGVFLSRIGARFVERFDPGKGAADARQVADDARAGQSLMFFPEGTLTRMPGLLPFQMGAFITAAEARVPLVPVVIRGTRFILRDGSWFPRRGPITVIVDEPIPPPAGADSWSVAVALRDAARERILRLCGEPDLGQEKPEIFDQQR